VGFLAINQHGGLQVYVQAIEAFIH